MAAITMEKVNNARRLCTYIRRPLCPGHEAEAGINVCLDGTAMDGMVDPGFRKIKGLYHVWGDNCPPPPHTHTHSHWVQ